MSKFSDYKNFFWSHKVSIFFVLTYWVIDPILYWHFGNAYIAGIPEQNRLLVFLAGPFSFSEDFKPSTPFNQALLDAAFSGNFWIPAATIYFVEWKIGSIFSIQNYKITMGKSYSIGVAASYFSSIIHFSTTTDHYPLAGTSIIAFSLLLTYFVIYPLLGLKLLRNLNSLDSRITNAFLAAIFGVALWVFWQYLISPSGYLHMTGFAIFILLYMILGRKTIKEMKEDNLNV